MNKNVLEERLLMSFVILFFIFLYFYRPSNQINKFESTTNEVTVVSDNKDNIIIKENNITKKVDKTCTHNGCLVKYNKSTGKLICPCHNSEFKLNGEVIRGPATKNLTVTNNESFVNYNKIFDW